MSSIESTKLIRSTTAAVAGGTWHTHNPRPAAFHRGNSSFKNYFAKKAYTGSGSWSSIG